jgi:hypothetical protein
MTKNVSFYKFIFGLQGVKDISLQEIMILILVKKAPHMVFLPPIQFDQNAMLDKSF